MDKLTFDDLATLSRDDLRTVRRQVEAETVQRALCILFGDSGEVFDAFRMTMGEANWQHWLKEKAARGPVPAVDVVAARLEIVETALALVEYGYIHIPALSYIEAAEAGNPAAQANLASLYRFGLGGLEEDPMLYGCAYPTAQESEIFPRHQ